MPRHIYPGEEEHLAFEGEVDSQGEGRIRILGVVGAEVGVEVLTPTTNLDAYERWKRISVAVSLYCALLCIEFPRYLQHI